MKISIFGLGYVGAVSAGCLASQGHRVTGVDPNQTKVDIINAGKSPIIEQGIGELVADAVCAGHLQASTDARAAVLASELSLVCVGTPSQSNGSLDLAFVRRVCEEIGDALADKDEHHTVVIRSTMLPGSMRDTVLPVLEEHSGKQVGVDFGVCNNPEFLREGTAVYDYFHPPKTVIGETDAGSGKLLASLYQDLDAPLIRTDLSTAEMVKYVDNVWHALKVTFANEVGNICKASNLDSHKVMDIFCQDTKLNLSPVYLKPGFAFGGSCLPKDVRALSYRAKRLDLSLPIISAILPSNQLQIEHALEMVTAAGSSCVGILGMSFKAGTDDLRESPMVELIERLIGKGYDLRVLDHNVRMASLTGANKDYILNRIPHISRLMVSELREVVAHADTIVLGTNDPEFRGLGEMLEPRHKVVDLVRTKTKFPTRVDVDGICW
jgi:GDP-mannose 6-dehydrogenase